MALIDEFVEVSSDVQRVHGRVSCGYRSFTAQGRRYLQLDTYGSADRVQKGTISQSIQLDEKAAEELVKIISAAFPSLGRRV